MPSTHSTSVTSFTKTHSVKSGLQVRTVITAPPWAREEPPSPEEEEFLGVPSEDVIKRRPSDVASYQSSDAGPSRWWSFTRTRLPRILSVDNEVLADIKSDLKGYNIRERWATPSTTEDTRQVQKQEENSNPWGLRITLPAPSPALFTMSHPHTPGWDSPWTARAPLEHSRNRNHYSQMGNVEEEPKDNPITPDTWRKRKRKIRGYLLTNPYVPLLFRFINVTLTTSALAMAIRIRLLEKQHGVMGAVGSSPTLAIIFAPLTLVHVMIAIYLEYFGRPLGLWHTSAKLAHTLSETLFICAWSAALSLCFDNYFTSVVPCAQSGTHWYNEIPPPPTIPGLGRFEGGVGDRICDYQLALICLVGVGLIMYCTNLIISLYRIFEKVKYHPASSIHE